MMKKLPSNFRRRLLCWSFQLVIVILSLMHTFFLSHSFSLILSLSLSLTHTLSTLSRYHTHTHTNSVFLLLSLLYSISLIFYSIFIFTLSFTLCLSNNYLMTHTLSLSFTRKTVQCDRLLDYSLVIFRRKWAPGFVCWIVHPPHHTLEAYKWSFPASLFKNGPIPASFLFIFGLLKQKIYIKTSRRTLA